MTTENIWKGVRSRIQIYIAERDKLKNEIKEHKSEIHVRDIQDKVWNLYMGRLSEFRQEPAIGENAMMADLLEYYLIVCDSYSMVPQF